MSALYLIQAHRLAEAGAKAGIDINSFIFADETYTLPSYGWVNATFAAAWNETMRRLGVQDWKAGSNDCDDFARMCAGYAQLLNNFTVQRAQPRPVKPDEDLSLAFGEFWFQPESGGGHAINVFFYTNVDGMLVPGFFEPQTANIVQLTPREIQSARFIRL